MKMFRKRWLAGAMLATLQGCGPGALYSEEPSFTMTVAGNYNAVSECSFLKLREDFELFRKNDFPATRMVELERTDGNFSIASIQFVDAGASTSVRGRLMNNKGWEPRFRPIIASCAQ